MCAFVSHLFCILHPTYNRASQETQEIILDYPCAQLAMQNSTQRYIDGLGKGRSITRVAQLCMAQLGMFNSTQKYSQKDASKIVCSITRASQLHMFLN